MAVLTTSARRGVNTVTKRSFGSVLVLAALLLARGAEVSAQTTAVGEYQVKAAFLFNFAHFVEWPPQAFPETQTPLIIGVLGKDPFGAFLDETVRNETVNNRPLIIERYRQVDEIKACHVLFISESESGQLGKIISALKDRNILTVGDTDDFAGRGGMIRFVTENNKIRLRINREAAEAAHLTISSKLLGQPRS